MQNSLTENYPLCSCLYGTKLSNVFNECGKKVKAKMSEAIVEHHVHVRVFNVHI